MTRIYRPNAKYGPASLRRATRRGTGPDPGLALYAAYCPGTNPRQSISRTGPSRCGSVLVAGPCSPFLKNPKDQGGGLDLAGRGFGLGDFGVSVACVGTKGGVRVDPGGHGGP